MQGQARNRSFSRISSGKLLEPEATRLQNDIEALTKAMGLQGRRTASLDERVQHYSREILKKKERLGKFIPSSKEEQALQNKLLVLDNQLCKERVKLNTMTVENQRIQAEIDVYRREKCTLVSVLKTISTESSSLAEKAEDANRVTRQREDEETHFRKELIALKLRSEENMGEYQRKSKDLLVEIEQDRSVHKDVSKSVEKFYPDSLVFFDNNQVLKALYLKWTTLCKEQKKAVDQYSRSVRYLSDAFAEIKEATGICSISEMVTGLIKAQEQEKALLANLNKAMAQADDLESRLSELQLKHDTMLKAQKAEWTCSEERLNDLNRELAGLRSLLKRKKDKQALVMQEVESIQQPISDLLTLFRESRLQGTDARVADSTLVRGADVMQKVAMLEKAILFMVHYIGLGENVFLPAVFGRDLEAKGLHSVSRGAISAVPIDDSSQSQELDRPLTALEIRQRTRQKFSQVQP